MFMFVCNRRALRLCRTVLSVSQSSCLGSSQLFNFNGLGKEPECSPQDGRVTFEF